MSERRARLEKLVRGLCSDECAGRRTGSPGGLLARELVRDALRATGLAVTEQPIAANGGANLIVEVEGRGPLADRVVLVGAHYDHLGTGSRGEIYRGADDNAAAVALLVEAAREVAASRADGRRVVFVAFDAEEPPFFLGGSMGSEVLAASGRVPLDRIDAMVAMDLVGHGIGPEALPEAVRKSLFVLGAEKSDLGDVAEARARATKGVHARRLDAEIIPPLSDYEPFWRRNVPFLFLTCGRSSVYHTPEDTVDRLDLAKIEASAGFLAGLTMDLAAQAPRARFFEGRRDDRVTLATLGELAAVLAPFSPQAGMAAQVIAMLADEAKKRELDEGERATIAQIVAGLETALA